MQPGVSDPGAPVSKCPAGTVALSGPGAIDAPPGGTSPVSSASSPSGVCFRLLGKPVTFTTAWVDVYEQPAGSQPVQHPASWQVQVYLPAAEAAELEAITSKLVGTQDQMAIIIGGQTWDMPITLHPLTGGEFGISADSEKQALQIQRLLQ
jgi:preprotein translocase subunit SecD